MNGFSTTLEPCGSGLARDEARPGTTAGATAGNAAALRIDAFSAQGQWNPLDNGGTARIEKLNLQALQLLKLVLH